MGSGYVLSDEVVNHKINEPVFPKNSSYKAEKSLNDLDLFTKGQPVDFYKELRDNAPIYFHDPIKNTVINNSVIWCPIFSPLLSEIF